MLRSEPIQLEELQGGHKALDTEINEEYAPKPKGEIRIPLPKKYTAKAISGDSGIIDSVTRMFGVVDRLVTDVRIAQVVESFALGGDGGGVGTLHTELSHDIYLSFLYILGLGSIALLDEHIYRVEQRRKDNEKQNIYKLLFQNPASQHNDEPIPDNVLEIMEQIHLEQIVNNLNYYLNQERIADKALKEKYSAIFIDAKTKKFVFQRHASVTKEPEILKSKVLGSIWEYGVKPFYRAGGFAGFAFWLMWMGATAITGIQMEGIYGMAPWVGVSIPGAFGLMHLGAYYYNAGKYGGFEEARQHAEAVADFDVLLKTLKQREHDREMKYLQKRNNELSAELEKRGLAYKTALKPESKNLMIRTANGVLEQPLIKGAFTVVTDSAATWGGTNSYSWYIKVLIETAYMSIVPAVLSTPLIGTVVGGVILGLSCISGLYNGYNRYKEAKAFKDAPSKALASTVQTVSEKYDLVVIEKGKKILHPVQNKIYLEEINGRIAYTLMTSDKQIIRRCSIDSLSVPQPFDLDNVSNLKKQIIEATVKAGHTAKMPTPIPLEDFEKHYKSRLEYFEKLNAEIQDYKKTTNPKSNHYVTLPGDFDVPEKNSEDQKPKSFLGRCKEKIYDVSIAFRNHPVIDAWDLSLTGIFIGRVAFTTAAPFLLAPLLPIALTGPIGIAAIAGVGLAYLALKWYEKYQIKKEQRAKDLPGMLEGLEKNIEDAELVVNDMRKSKCLIYDDIVRHKASLSQQYKSHRHEASKPKMSFLNQFTGVGSKDLRDAKMDECRTTEAKERKEERLSFAC